MRARLQFGAGDLAVADLVPGAMNGADVTDDDGRVIGQIVRVVSITSSGVEVEADITDPAMKRRIRG